ncbi:MAG: D-alanyl-D-alanine carboxypeptidase, partial [Clostridiales bacterium]|nr:D-alanyl-D-alanine carboxypeptidase [Clostridiales bacterium]
MPSEAEALALWDYLDASRFGDEAVLSDTVSPEFDFDVKSACLIEAETGTILYEYNKDDRYMPASVTKVMTLLLVFEAIDSGKISFEDTVTASEHAASMGGTQIYLKVGETMSVEDLVKAVVVPSANDAAVALAEFVAGSEEEFVRQMNERAKELGMENTNFTNCTGLFDD